MCSREKYYVIEDNSGNCWCEIHEYFCDSGTEYDCIEDMPEYIQCPNDREGKANLVVSKKYARYIDEKTNRLWGKVKRYKD
jgi:hypothetical protein